MNSPTPTDTNDHTTIGPLLRAARIQAGRSQTEQADELSTLAGRPVTRNEISRWENETRLPSPYWQKHYATSLGITSDVLRGAVSRTRIARRKATSLPGRADMPESTVLRRSIDEIRWRYQDTPSVTLLAEAVGINSRAASTVKSASTEKCRRELLGTFSLSSTLLGQLVWDASGRRDHVRANHYYGLAITAARDSGDSTVEAQAQLRMSFVHLYGRPGVRDPLRGLALALSAAERAGHDHALAAMALLHVGEAHAMTAEYRLTEKALSRARRHLESLDGGGQEPGHGLPGEFGRVSGSCYLFLGAPERAESCLREAADDLVGQQKSRSLVLGNLASSLIRQRKIDEAVTILDEAIDAVEQSRGAGGLGLVFGAGRELYPWRNESVVQDVTDRLLSLMAVR